MSDIVIYNYILDAAIFSQIPFDAIYRQTFERSNVPFAHRTTSQNKETNRSKKFFIIETILSHPHPGGINKKEKRGAEAHFRIVGRRIPCKIK